MHSNDKITNQDSIIGAVIKISEGNPGALTVSMQLLKKEHGAVAIVQLDDLGIRGWKIWVGFKDYCNQDIDVFYEHALTRDKGMIDFINECPG